LSRLLQRMPQIQLETKNFEYRPVYFLRALKSLPITLHN
jgi:cytochrome P450